MALELWTRRGSRDRDDVESQKWFHPLQQAVHAPVPLAQKITFINDREGDIFALWDAVGQANHDLITRAKQDRNIAVTTTCPAGKLFADLEAQPIRGQFDLDISADTKTQRTARKSVMEVRWVQVELRRPQRSPCPTERVKVWAIEIKECEACVPEGQQPFCWKLLTTHNINNLANALQVVQWYLYRWRIEDGFGALKTRGVDIEASRLHRGQALMKLCVMSLWSANRLNTLVKGRNDEITNASEFFSSEELTCMSDINPRLEGTTTHQHNKYRPQSLAWAVWILARLGRWHCDGAPGTETIHRGLEKFEGVFLGWEVNRRI